MTDYLEAFSNAFDVIKERDSRLAEKYICRYWDKYEYKWDEDLITDIVVRKIQIDMLNVTLSL
jgi:hypothetical protein